PNSQGTHNFPLYYDPPSGSWRAYEMPDPSIGSLRALNYFFYPARDPRTFLLMNTDEDSLTLGGGFHDVTGITYQGLTQLLQTGVPRDRFPSAFWASYPDMIDVGH